MKSKLASKHIIGMLIFLLVLGGVCMGAYQYHQRQSPAYVLQEAGKAIEQKDEEKFREMVDVDTFLVSGYDEGSALLADNIETLHQLYPADPFFQHTPDFMRQYTAAHRQQSLDFMQQVVHDYFAGPDSSIDFETDRAQWLAAQLVKFRQSGHVHIAKIEEKGDTAYATLTFTGDASPYGKLLNPAQVVLELKRTQDTWKISRIANGTELLYPAAEGAEEFWTLQGWQ